MCRFVNALFFSSLAASFKSHSFTSCSFILWMSLLSSASVFISRHRLDSREAVSSCFQSFCESCSVQLHFHPPSHLFLCSSCCCFSRLCLVENFSLSLSLFLNFLRPLLTLDFSLSIHSLVSAPFSLPITLFTLFFSCSSFFKTTQTALSVATTSSALTCLVHSLSLSFPKTSSLC